MSVLEKIQKLPETKRKVILWTALATFAVLLGFFWFKDIKKRFSDFKIDELKEELNIPSLEEELKNLPKFE